MYDLSMQYEISFSYVINVLFSVPHVIYINFNCDLIESKLSSGILSIFSP